MLTAALKLAIQNWTQCYWTDFSSSPPGPYHQDAYLTRAEDKLKNPPVLPPHLLQVLLNKDTGISVSCLPAKPPIGSSVRKIMTLCVVHHQCDPTLLPEPNHVMLNHLYALSIKVRNRACFYFENQSPTPFLSFKFVFFPLEFIHQFNFPLRIIEGFDKSI